MHICGNQPEWLLAGVCAQMRLEGAGPGIRFAAYSAQVGSAVVVAAAADAAAATAGGDARRTDATDADRVFTPGEL